MPFTLLQGWHAAPPYCRQLTKEFTSSYAYITGCRCTAHIISESKPLSVLAAVPVAFLSIGQEALSNSTYAADPHTQGRKTWEQYDSWWRLGHPGDVLSPALRSQAMSAGSLEAISCWAAASRRPSGSGARAGRPPAPADDATDESDHSEWSAGLRSES